MGRTVAQRALIERWEALKPLVEASGPRLDRDVLQAGIALSRDADALGVTVVQKWLLANNFPTSYTPPKRRRKP